MVLLFKTWDLFMTSLLHSSWDAHASVVDHLRNKTPNKGLLTPAQQRKHWIASIKDAIGKGDVVGLKGLLGGKHSLKHTDEDVFAHLAQYYTAEVAQLLHNTDLCPTLNWNHYPYLLRQDSGALVEFLSHNPANCVFSDHDDVLHKTLYEGMSGLYVQAVRRAFSRHCTERERSVAVGYRTQLETLFPQLAQEPYLTYCANLCPPLAWGCQENIAFLEARCDIIDWKQHFPEHNNLAEVVAFFDLCGHSPIVKSKFVEYEAQQTIAAVNSRKLAKCFEGKNGIASSYTAFSMGKWIKGCSKEMQEQEFFDEILMLKRPEHVLLGLTPKEMYLSNRMTFAGRSSRRTRHGSWDLPELVALSWFHAGVAQSGEIVDVMLQSPEGITQLQECLNDPSVLMGFLGACSINTLQHTLKAVPPLVQWRDAHNNSIGHYCALMRNGMSKGLAEVLVKHDPALLSEENRLNVSAMDVLKKTTGESPVEAISKMLLGKSLRQTEPIQRKIRGRGGEGKRKM